MLTSRSNNANNTRLSLVLPSLGDTTERHQEPLLQGTARRPMSNSSTKSIDNPFSLEHLFTALRRRIRRIVQTYNITAFHHALKICAGVFQSYANYNLHTIDEFARRLQKGQRDNKKISTSIDQFRLQLSELRHCHSTFETELLVTTLAIDFHESDIEQTQRTLPSLVGKFSPRSRVSRFRVHHIRQAMELKSQLKQTNEHLQILLFDEFTANASDLWVESEKYVSATIPYHDHHMTYVLRLIPDIALKFEYALQLCTKLFELETAMMENHSQTHTNENNNDLAETGSVKTATITPRSDHKLKNHSLKGSINQQTQTSVEEQKPKLIPPIASTLQQQKQIYELPQQQDNQSVVTNNRTRKTSAFFSTDERGTSSASTPSKFINTNTNSMASLRRDEPFEMIKHDNNPLIPPLSLSSEQSFDYKDDLTKLQILIKQLDKRLFEEERNYQRVLNFIEQTEKKSQEMGRLTKSNMLTLVPTNQTTALEYKKALYLSDCQIQGDVLTEFYVAEKEIKYRIDWIKMVKERARQCLEQ